MSRRPVTRRQCEGRKVRGVFRRHDHTMSDSGNCLPTQSHAHDACHKNRIRPIHRFLSQVLYASLATLPDVRFYRNCEQRL